MSTRPIRLTPLRRHLAALLTIALSSAFVAVTLLAGVLMQQSLTADATSMTQGADLVAVPADDGSPDTPAEAGPAPDLPGARAHWPLLSSMTPLRAGDHQVWAEAAPTLPAEASAPALLEGVEADGAGEVVIDQTLAQALHVGLGDEITPDLAAVRQEPSTAQEPLRIVGIAPPPEGSGLMPAQPRVMVTEDTAPALLGAPLDDAASGWLYAGGDTAVPPSADGWTIRTSQQLAQDQSDRLAEDFVGIGAVIGAFVLVALVTAVVVVTTTFTVTLAQRIRDLALLRTVGATGGQVARTVVGESLRVGLLGAIGGVLLGHLLVEAALLGAHAVGWVPRVHHVPLSLPAIAAPLVIGVLISLTASILPLRRALAVRPLEAMREAVPAVGRPSPRRLVLPLIPLALGIVLLTVGTVSVSPGSGETGGPILLAMSGGALSLIGVLLLLPLLVPLLARALRRLLPRTGLLPARLAVANVARTPGRTAATLAALLIGTSLMSMMAVGARTAQATLDEDLAHRKPIDLVVRADELPADLVDDVRGIDGIATAEQVPTAELPVGADDTMTAIAMTPDQVHALSVRERLTEHLEDGVLLTGAARAERFGLHDGQRLELPGPDGTTTTLRVKVEGNLDLSLITPGTRHTLSPEAEGAAIPARLSAPGSPEREDRQAIAIISDVQQAVAEAGVQDSSFDVEGAEREKYAEILQVMLGITLALLGVAVLVALVGVASTLGLGVIERTGDNALLRALGSSRAQMRSMLGWEGALLGLIGALGGVALGIVYGLLGVHVLIGSLSPIVVGLPWGQLVAVLAASVGAGWLASVLPARRAARTAPARALAAG